MSDTKPRIFTQSFASISPAYVQKAEQKGRSQREVDKIIRWLTGCSQRQLNARLRAKADVEDPVMREIRYFDKLIDELGRRQSDGEDPPNGV